MLRCRSIRRWPCERGGPILFTCCLAVAASVVASAAAGQSVHVCQKVELTFHAERPYDNPYKDVEVWVDLKGPGLARRCYGFWDGGATFRVRVLATAPGTWTWTSSSDPPDAGLDGIRGTFTSTPWSEAEKEENPCRRGMIRPSANGHAFEHADGTPFFLLGDTWWATPTFRYPWRDDGRPRRIGPGAGFQDYVRFRKRQGFNGIAMIAAFPQWANDGKPAMLKTADGVVLRAAWRQPGTQSAKDMHNEAGQRAFAFPGRVAGHEEVFPDLQRINPEYFRTLDRKIDYLNAQGMIPFLEVARRDIGRAWKHYYPWPESYTRYVQYVWSRYQANICLFSPIHFDSKGRTIPAEEWNRAANGVIAKYGPPPFGTLAGTNSNPSSLHNFGHLDRARWLGFHQIGNRRTHDVYALLTEIHETSPAVPAINGEPYYDGMLDAAPGSAKAALYCRSAMYGSVLSGGLGGHIYGAGGWDGGMWGGNVEQAAEHHVWDALRWPSAGQMQHLRTFVLSEGRRYQDLLPAADLLSPHKSGKPDSCLGWAYCARAPNRTWFLLYFEKGCPQATLSGVPPGRAYRAQWFDPRSGQWIDPAAAVLTAGGSGELALPPFPNGHARATIDWALKLTVVDEP